LINYFDSFVSIRHQVSRDKLPDVGTPYEGEGGTVQDAYEFILQNFCEANRLWCRMQNQVRASSSSFTD